VAAPVASVEPVAPEVAPVVAPAAGPIEPLMDPSAGVAAPVVGDAKSRPLTSMVLTLLLLAAGLVLGGSAALPPRYAPAALQRFYAAPDRRIVALATATAILMGFGVSFYLS